MRSPEPLVSLGMPVFNGEDYLTESLDSILAQDLTNLEVVISDNASTDGTEEICRDYVSQDSRVSYSRVDHNHGAAPNYNRVFHMASGKYFKWAAHDDLLRPHYLSHCVEAFQVDNPPVLVYPTSERIDADGDVIGPLVDRVRTNSDNPAIRVYQTVQGVSLMASVFGLYDRAALGKTQLIGSFVGSDYALLVEMAMLGNIHFAGGPPLFQRRVHEQSSRQVNVSKEDALRWFDTNAKSILPVYPRLYLEYLKSAARSPEIGVGQKALCMAAAMSAVAYRRTRVFGGRWRQKLMNKADRSPQADRSTTSV